MNGPRRLLAIASGGGHWTELMRLRPAFAGWDVAYVSMFDNYADVLEGARYYAIPDASRFDTRPFLTILRRAWTIMRAERPAAIVTTGSAPALPFLVLARLRRIPGLWIDSLGQIEELSMSGRIAKRLATVTLSQWPDVAAAEGVDCWGAVL